MKKINAVILTLLLGFIYSCLESSACTNFIVTKGASKNGSVMITYSADSHVLYGELYYRPAKTIQPGQCLMFMNGIPADFWER